MTSLAALYRLFLSSVATRGRIIGLLLLGAVAVLVGWAIGNNAASEHLEDGTLMVAGLGLALIAPVVALVIASSVLGDPSEDGTLVYVWLRPVPRWQIAVAAVAAAITVSVPVVVVPMTISAALTNAPSALVGATVASCVVATLAYCGLFTFLGLRVKRALPWGLAYILIWEGFIARAGDGTELLSIRAHTVSLLTRLADGPPRLRSSSLLTSIVLPLGAAIVATYLAARRLQQQDVA
jgi:ABC-2 type transport system permease protein